MHLENNSLFSLSLSSILVVDAATSPHARHIWFALALLVYLFFLCALQASQPAGLAGLNILQSGI